ncbi:hypothetical protein BJV78DRAFT_1159099 [Lactifluus subvellereus]|nr:hypothetical protein BJV78DRAFT_1159099 [Lactifluus subvellereus]
MLSTGLGGRGDRRDVSPSDAEYNPGCPLQDLIAGILGTRFNLFATLRKAATACSRQGRYLLSFAPSLRAIHSSSSSEPDTPDLTSSKPKLSDALSHLTFSRNTPGLLLESQSNSVPFDPLIIDSMADSELDQVLYSTPGPLLVKLCAFRPSHRRIVDSTAELDQVLSAQHARAATWLRLWELCTIQSVVYMHQEVVWVVKTEQDLKEGVRYKIQRCAQGDDAPQLIRNGYGLVYMVMWNG